MIAASGLLSGCTLAPRYARLDAPVSAHRAMAGEGTGLFDTGSGSWSFVSGLSIPIFNTGRDRANVATASR